MNDINNEKVPVAQQNNVVDVERIKKDGIGLGVVFYVLGALLCLAGVIFTSSVDLIIGLLFIFAGWQTRRIQKGKQNDSTTNTQPSSSIHD